MIKELSIDSLIFPWLVYSLLSLIFDIEMPKYVVFRKKTNIGSALVTSCRRFIQANSQIRRSPLFSLVPGLSKVINLHLLNETNLKQIQHVLDQAIQFRLDNGLLGLSDCYKRPSKKRVKFRDEIFSSLLAEGKTDVNTNEINSDISKQQTEHRAQLPRAQLKELTFIDIIMNYEIEPEDKLEGIEVIQYCDHTVPYHFFNRLRLKSI